MLFNFRTVKTLDTVIQAASEIDLIFGWNTILALDFAIKFGKGFDLGPTLFFNQF